MTLLFETVINNYPIIHRLHTQGDPAAAQTYKLRLLCLYMSESLTLSQQSAATTSLLLSKTDWKDIQVSGKISAAAVQGPSISDYA